LAEAHDVVTIKQSIKMTPANFFIISSLLNSIIWKLGVTDGHTPELSAKLVRVFGAACSTTGRHRSPDIDADISS